MSEGLDLAIGAPGEPEVDLTGLDLDDHLVDESAADTAGPLEIPEVSELQVRSALAAVGGLTGFVLGDKRIEGHWRFTDTELEDLTPPVTRIVNRTPALARVVAHSDAATAGIVIVRYAFRNLDLSRRAKEIDNERAQDRRGGLPAAGVRGSDGGDGAGAPLSGTQAPRPTGRAAGIDPVGPGGLLGDAGAGAQ